MLAPQQQPPASPAPQSQPVVQPSPTTSPEHAKPWWLEERPYDRSLPLLVVLACWLVLIVNIVSAAWLMCSPFERSSEMLIDARWHYVALPVLYLPTIFVFSYVNWLGWTFFAFN
jgi:hypothetical protein